MTEHFPMSYVFMKNPLSNIRSFNNPKNPWRTSEEPTNVIKNTKSNIMVLELVPPNLPCYSNIVTLRVLDGFFTWIIKGSCYQDKYFALVYYTESSLSKETFESSLFVNQEHTIKRRRRRLKSENAGERSSTLSHGAWGPKRHELSIKPNKRRRMEARYWCVIFPHDVSCDVAAG